jgi:DNA-binding SARP family transcriptional activator/FixJ family two-component response regulator
MSDNPHTILVVDPDERSYRTFESVLGVSNRVLFVQNGQTAIDVPDTQNIDVIYVSDALSGTGGIMLLESFKKRFPSIPVVFISEQPKVDKVITAFRSGARELIIKPIDEKELVAVTQKIIGFLSNKKSKRRWFFITKKKSYLSPETGCKENTLGNIRKVFRKIKKRGDHSQFEIDQFYRKKSIHAGKNLSNKLIVNENDSLKQKRKKRKHFKRIKKPNPHILAYFFGPFRILVNDQPIANWPSKKGRSILAYVILNRKKKIFRDVLMDLFWQKSCPDSARNCLNVTIHGLRRVLEDVNPKFEYIMFKDECYYFNPEIRIWLDVEEFRKAWRNAQSIEQHKGLTAAFMEFKRAAGIYKADFLEEEIYNSWSSFDRENLKEIYLVILEKISEYFMQNNDHIEARHTCESILEKDNCREDIHRRLMRCYFQNGQRERALKQFQKCTEALKTELEVEPTESTIELYQKLRGRLQI